ncbi:uncharacterized protein LOC124160852 [Ischnura elegans]|uniref:uncharacterized protein LOC124160852 n=1 Tax=Ischnura elegans TaxID=197161 RepID=UPI001ED8A5CF|nr:uncharacterized protein LOC124160852 [Ischnura elegans]
MAGNSSDNDDDRTNAEESDRIPENGESEAPSYTSGQNTPPSLTSGKNTLGTPEPVNSQSSSCQERGIWSLKCRDWILITITLAVAVWVCYSNGLPSSDSSDQFLNGKINSYISNWRTNYPNQLPETWGTIAGQLSQFTEIGNVSPLVIVLAYSKARRTTLILASEISRAALELVDDPDKCGDTDTARLLGDEIKGGYLLNTFLPQVEKCRKMIITNLEKLNATAAKDLHSMVDPDYPNIPNVVYIFTVEVPSVERNVYREVRQVLTSKWSTLLGEDQVNALLSRLVNNVGVFPEPAFE